MFDATTIQKARELVQWWDTGILPDGLIKQRAGDPTAKWMAFDGYSPRDAEREFIGAIIRQIAALGEAALDGEDTRGVPLDGKRDPGASQD